MLVLPLIFALLFFQQAPRPEFPPPSGPPQGPVPAERGSISGRVHALDGTPLRRAQIMLIPIGIRGQTPLSIMTEADGSFVFAEVPPGRYRVSADRNGYVRSEYGQRSPRRPGTTLTLNPKQELKDIAIRLAPGAVIAGRVMDEEGEPIANAQVAALRPDYSSGRRRLVPMRMGTTNDRGEYRIFGLPAGRYYLSASLGGRGPFMRGGGAAGQETAYATSYYPNASDTTRAVALEVAAGAELPGTDFTLNPIRTVRVRGRVLGHEPPQADGRGRPGTSVLLVPNSDSGMMRPQGAGAVQPDGSWEIRGVAPGSYTLVVNRWEQDRQRAIRMPLEVGTTDLNDVTLTVPPEINLAGTVRVEGESTVPLGNLQVLFEAREFLPMMGPGMGKVQEDGTFVAIRMSPEQYNVNVVGLPAEYYLKSVRAGPNDVTETGLDLTSGAAPEGLEILISPRAGRIEGTAVTDNEAAANAVIVLVPEESRRTVRRFFKSTHSGEDGRFSFTGIPPGDYKVLAWEDIDEGSWMDPAVLSKFESSGVTVRVREGSVEPVQVRAVRDTAP